MEQDTGLPKLGTLSFGSAIPVLSIYTKGKKRDVHIHLFGYKEVCHAFHPKGKPENNLNIQPLRAGYINYVLATQWNIMQPLKTHLDRIFNDRYDFRIKMHYNV